jgi:hypothetical protein
MKKLFFFLEIILLLPTLLPAQTVIEGLVSEVSDGRDALTGAAVVLSINKENDIGFSITNAKGYYRIPFISEADSLFLTVSLLGFESRIIKINNQSQTRNIRLSSKEIELKDVLVEAPTVFRKGDTIVYRVDAFTSAKDRVISDVLKNMPGFEVTDKGEIRYNDKPINQFTVENMDLLGGKYRIASDNIPADAVQNVEVLENFEPIRAMKGLSDSDRASVNLKLKKDKLLRPFGTVLAGIGGFEDFLRDLNAFSMHVATKHQSILTYKTNNTGLDLRPELKEFSMDNIPVSTASPLSGVLKGDQTGSPPLPDNRYLFNNTHSFTLNHLRKLSNSQQLKLNINYLRDKIDQKAEQSSSYFLKDSTLLVHERKTSERKSDELELSLNFKNNAARYYIADQVRGKSNWVNSYSTILNRHTIHERYELPEYLLENTLRTTLRFNNKAFSLQSFVRYSSLPQRVEITSDTIGTAINQSVFRSGFYTTNGTSFAHQTGKSQLNLQANVEASFEQMDSELQSAQYTDSLHNNLSFDYVKTTLTPAYSYKTGNIFLTLQAPVVQQNIFIRDPVYDDKKDLSIFYANPSIRFRYTFNPFLTGDVAARYATSYGIDILDFAQSYMMLNYRSVNKTGSEILSKSGVQNYSASLDYKNMLKFLYLNFSVSYSSSELNTMSNVQFEESSRMVSNKLNMTNRRSSWNYRARGEKYIPGIKGKLSLAAGYTRGASESMQQSVVFPQISETVTLTPGFDMKFNNRIIVTYKYNYLENRRQIQSAKETIRTSLPYSSHNLSCFYSIFKHFSANVSADYTRNSITEQTSKNLFFADAGFNYQTGKLEFSLLCNNLFNQKEYTYTIQSLDVYTYSYRLRPTQLWAKIIFKY